MDNIEMIKDAMPVDEEVYDLAELFKMLCDATRVKILYAILDSEMSVSDITEIVGSTQSAVSHQLRVLKQARLVSTRRDGKTIFYSLCDDHVQKIFYYAMENVME